jgi:DNA-binding response OmpR family regulator
MRILIAEDESFSRALLERALRKFGHDVVGVGDGAQAWAAMEREWFRVIISDWIMPESDGLDLCRQIRARREAEYVYFILLTGRQRSHENLNEAIGAGVDDFLSKPFEQDEIMTRLRVAERILGYTTRIRQLEEILPVCSYCKKIRNDQQYWQRMEEYFNQAAGVDFSHSICPDCYETQVAPQIEELKQQMAAAKARPRGAAGESA